MKYLLDEGCPCDKVACTEAARNGHLECLKYLHDKGYPWDELTCSEAASGGHFECLKYLHENGFLGTKVLVIMLPKMVTPSV